MFFPWWGDVEVVEDGSLGGGEAVESDAVVGVGESESLGTVRVFRPVGRAGRFSG